MVILQPGSYHGDILLDDIKIEVKTATLNSRGYYQINLRKHKHCDISHSDILIIVLLNDDTDNRIYIMPTYVVGDRRQLTLSKNSMFNRYIDRFDYITQI